MNAPTPAAVHPAGLAVGSHPLRPEIQGLRAIAILAVLLFHAGIDRLPGGFLGVDIFFVISGFLITRNILAAEKRGAFAFREFYRRRIRRIAPALIVTLLGSLLAAVLLFPTGQQVPVAQSALFAALGVSNILFSAQAGYFDQSALLKPLLHTWSLGVEEQFYLLWPLALLLVSRQTGTRQTAALIALAGLASLAAAFFAFRIDREAAFYWMPFRVFEFAIGALLVLPELDRGPKPAPLARSIASVIGLLLIAYALLRLHEGMRMPGPLSLIPCAGAALVIAAGSVRATAPLLSNGVMLWFGRISYSLYLVHWPVVVFLRFLWPEATPVGQIIGAVALSIALAALLYYGVERPFLSPVPAARFRLRGVAAGWGVALAAAIGIAAIGGVNLSRALPAIPTADEMWKTRQRHGLMEACFLTQPGDWEFDDFDPDVCLASPDDSQTVLVLGDSLSADLFSALTEAYPQLPIRFAAAGNCYALVGIDKPDFCPKLMAFILQDFLPRHRVGTVILSGNWLAPNIERLAETVDYLEPYVDRIIVAGPPLRFLGNVPTMIAQSGAHSVREARDFVFARQWGADVNAALRDRFGRGTDPKVGFLDVSGLMLSNGPELFSDDDELLFIDFAHLTRAGASYLADRMRQRLADRIPVEVSG